MMRTVLIGIGLLLLATGCGTVDRVSSTGKHLVKQVAGPDPGYVLRISPYFRSDDDGSGHSYKAKARGHLDLPGFQEIWGIPVGEPRRNETPRDGVFRPWVSGVFTAGYDHAPVVGMGIKAGLTFDAKHWRLRLQERPVWHSNDGLKNINQVDWRYEWTDTVRVQASTQFKWEEKEDESVLYQLLQVHKNLPSREQIGLRFFTFEAIDSDWRYTGALLRAFCRYEIQKNKYYLHLEPGLALREQTDWDLKPTIFLRFDMLFGDTCDHEVDHLYGDF